MTSSPVPRSHSRTSFYSTTTYHSFQDIELYDHSSNSGSQSETSGVTSAPRSTTTASSRRSRIPELKAAPVRRPRPSQHDDAERHPAGFKMLRQDSGYESSTPQKKQHHTATHVPLKKESPQPTPNYPRRRHTSQAYMSPDNTSRPVPPSRPALRRSATSKPGGPISHMPAGPARKRSSLNLPRPTAEQIQRKHSYFQFPSPEHLDEPQLPTATSTPRQSIDLAPVIRKVNTANNNKNQDDNNDDDDDNDEDDDRHRRQPLSQSLSPPPQTTHYWTSDRTRRLEYAAIDAASRGVRGWVLRHVVPDCLHPHQVVGFDEDAGSVRRYRLELEIECPEDSVPPAAGGEKKKKKGFRARRKGWWARLRGCTN